MRELKEEELEMVRGGSAIPGSLPTDWYAALSQRTFTPENLMRKEVNALDKLKGHTLLDQLSSDS